MHRELCGKHRLQPFMVSAAELESEKAGSARGQLILEEAYKGYNPSDETVNTVILNPESL